MLLIDSPDYLGVMDKRTRKVYFNVSQLPYKSQVVL